MIKANDFRSSIRRHKQFESKIHPLKSLYSQKKQTPFFENTEMLQWDVKVLDHFFDNGNQNPFYIELTKTTITTMNAWATRPPLTGGGGDATSAQHANTKKREVQWRTKCCRTVYSMYVIIRNVFKTIYDVYMSYFKLAFNITIIFRINVNPL
jgi:hypothetical protein